MNNEQLSEEFCSHCDNVFDVDPDKLSLCPNCGEILVPCNACEDHTKCGNECQFYGQDAGGGKIYNG